VKRDMDDKEKGSTRLDDQERRLVGVRLCGGVWSNPVSERNETQPLERFYSVSVS
jgi:hypothetical protein